MVFAIHWHESATCSPCTCVPHPEPPPTSPVIPSLRVVPLHQPWAPCLMHRNLGWQSVSHMIIHMYQCYSLKSSHPRFLPQSWKAYSLCLFCCLAYRVIITIFLSSLYIYIYICALVYCIGVFLSDLTSLCIIGSTFIHLIRTDSNAFFLLAE